MELPAALQVRGVVRAETFCWQSFMNDPRHGPIREFANLLKFNADELAFDEPIVFRARKEHHGVRLKKLHLSAEKRDVGQKMFDTVRPTTIDVNRVQVRPG